MPGPDKSTANPTRPLGKYCSELVTTPLSFAPSHPIARNTKPTEAILQLFHRAPQQGIRVVNDPDLNRRLEDVLRRHLKKAEEVPPILDVLAETGLRPGMGGVWKEWIKPGGEGGMWGWRFFRPAAPGQAEKTVTVWGLALPSELTAVRGELFQPQGGEKGGKKGKEKGGKKGKGVDREGENGGNPGEGKAAELIRLCSRPGGMMIGLAREEGEAEARPKVIDEKGQVVPKQTYWADIMSELFEKFNRYNIDLLTLSSYELNIPIELDSLAPNVLHVGHPIHREAATLGTGLGRLTPMELSVASVIPGRHVSTSEEEYPELPTNALARAPSAAARDKGPEAGKDAGGERGRGEEGGSGGRKRSAGEMEDGDRRAEGQSLHVSP
ncbi:hypothetical protein IAT38_005283 [Cryptococcus sp. DSM 104549]